MINWPIVLMTTVVLYALTILSLPFSAVYASVFLFAIIAFWSRLPGVGIPHPLFILYNTDFVDLFALLLAINLGPHWGIAMVIFGNVWSRVAGVHPEWGAIGSDTGSMSLACLAAPLCHSLMGGDILMTMIAFTTIRWILWQPMDLIFWPQVWGNIGHKIMLTLVGAPSLFLINIFYTQIFGDFFDNLLKAGVQFNWILFFFVTIVITIFYLSVFNRSKTPSTFEWKKIIKRFIGSSRKRMKKQKVKASHRSHKGRSTKRSLNSPHNEYADQYKELEQMKHQFERGK
jgi:hypothetical protein